jgi:inhibitor of Bruton tyrosine kinase
MGYELFVWGKNKNYNLGIGNVQGRPYPEYLDFFRKQKIFMQSVSLNYYHSLFLTFNGDVYCTGHGKGGRLGNEIAFILVYLYNKCTHFPGNGSENTLVTPTLIDIAKKYAEEEKITSISAGRYHSLLLSDHDVVSYQQFTIYIPYIRSYNTISR